MLSPMDGTWSGRNTAAQAVEREAGSPSRPTPEAMAVVQRSLSLVGSRPVALTEAFYRHLFEMAPGVRAMFPADMTLQNEKLLRALLDTIGALVEPDRYAQRMERNLRGLGDQHARRYGVRPEHYPFVGHALTRAIKEVSGDASATTSSAWVWVYNWTMATMLGTTRR
jgi:hemoglobin-like flavoprotein